MRCMVMYQNGALLVKTPYDQGFVADIKTLPANARKFDPGTKGWLIDPQYADKIERLIMLAFGEQIQIPRRAAQAGKTELRLLDLRYLGTVKDRGDEKTALGWIDGEWSAVFTEKVLRAWFEGVHLNSATTAASTLYAILGVRQNVGADEIKSAFRRMALQWHPDHCKEPDAGERFMRIKSAYDLLSNPGKRQRYDAGLALEAGLSRPPQYSASASTSYRAPLRCGYVLVEGFYQVGRFRVVKILEWRDIVDSAGRTLVVSWPRSSDRFIEQWV